MRIFVEEVFLSLSNTFPDERKVLVSKQKDSGGTNITTRTKFEGKNSLEEKIYAHSLTLAHPVFTSLTIWSSVDYLISVACIRHKIQEGLEMYSFLSAYCSEFEH